MAGSSLPLGPVILTRVDPVAVRPLIVATSDDHLPVESSASGGVFTDRFDSNLFWWLPDFRLAAAPDAAFAFAASVVGISDSSGLPLYSAQLTFGMVTVEPAGLAAARAARPDAAFQAIPLTSLDVSLTIIGKTDTGADDPRSYPALLVPGSEGSYTATVTLIGPAVTVAYDSLAHGTTATVTVQCSYSVWRQWRPWRWPPIMRPPILIEHPISTGVVSVAGDTAEDDARSSMPRSMPVAPISVRRWPPIEIGGGDGGDPPPQPIWINATDQATTTLGVGAAYATDDYRPRYTVATGAGPDAQARPIIDASDLTGFATARSEFVELTSLGAAADRYPSIRRLYFGLASGRIVIVPQAYRILRSSDGLAATLHAAVDDSPGPHVSGARFDFTFTLAPAIDAIDYAQLTHDVATIPEASGRTVTLVIADGLDARFPAAFTGFSASTSSVVDGSEATTLNLHVTIVDTDQTPALNLVNLFLDQLGSSTSPMEGTVAVRLDDQYPTPVTTAFAVELARTAAGNELALTATDATTVTAQNLGPLALHLTGAATIAPDGPHTVQLDAALAANATVAITVADATLPLAVRGEVDLGTPSRPADVLAFLDVQVETTQSIRHVLVFNATGAFTATVTQLDLAASLVAAPEVLIPPLTLTANHSLDSVAFTLPLVTALADLTCQIALTVSDGGAPRFAMLRHDFGAEPILIVTADDVAGAVPNDA